jgi:alkylresorcinol/alkylpyrone synthase
MTTQAGPRLAALATAVPPFILAQDAVAARVQTLFAADPNVGRLLPVFANAGIRRRHACVPLSWFEEPHGWPERNQLYLASAVPLLRDASARALDEAGIPAGEVGAVVTVSTTGIATPSLDARLIECLGLAPTVQRLPIFGLGCAGGVLGFGRAATMAAAMPDKAVLLLVIELCSLTFRLEDTSKSNIVGSALFGDGAAAAVLRCGGTGPGIIAHGEYTWPGSLDVMGWEVADNGLKPVFSRDIPTLVAGRLGSAVDDFLQKHGLSLPAIDRFVCHPGGPKVIASCEEAFGLPPDSLQVARAILRDFGNMSAASVLFVLERMLQEAGETGSPWEYALLTAFGPGFSAGFAVLRNC